VDAVRVVTEQVRDLIRRGDLDPVADPPAARHAIESAVAEYDRRTLRSPLPPVGDHDLLIKRVLDEVVGYGPLQPYLDDPGVEEIWVNEPGKVFVARDGTSELTTTMLTAGEVRDLVERMLQTSGRRIDLSNPFVDATLPDGSRLHVVIPDITRRHWAVNIRKFVVRADRLADLVRLGTLTAGAAAFLEGAVVAGLNVLVSGGTQAGKTTLLNCLAAAVPARERVVTCEEVFELRVALRDSVGMQCRQPSLEGTGEVPLRRLVTEALRMRPSRIIVGEVRQAEALDLLIALNSGLPGMCTVHANSAREAVTKMCTLPLLAGVNVSLRFVAPTVAATLDIVAHVVLDGDGRRRLDEVLAVTGRVEGDVVETTPLFVTDSVGRLVRATGQPPHPERFRRAGLDLPRLLAG
jgi:pilus assembly protein CpaF